MRTSIKKVANSRLVTDKTLTRLLNLKGPGKLFENKIFIPLVKICIQMHSIQANYLSALCVIIALNRKSNFVVRGRSKKYVYSYLIA